MRTAASSTQKRSGQVGLPRMRKIGSKLARPSWMNSLGVGMMYPRLFENAKYRANLPSLPATRFSVLYSSDHSSGTGYLGRVDFDDIEGTWTDAGQVHSGSAQRETPHPVYDAVNNRVLVYVHDNTVASGVTFSSQHTKVLTTTDLTSFSVAANTPMPYGNHTGYAQVIQPGEIDSNYHAYHVLNAGESFVNGRSTSVDGVSFSLSETWSPMFQHLCGEGQIFQGVPFVFRWKKQWYLLSNLSPLPRLTNDPVSIVAIPIVSATNVTPVGGYVTLITPGANSSDPDFRLTNYLAAYEVDNRLYLFYSGKDGSGVDHLCVAVGDEGAPIRTNPQIGLNGVDGRLSDFSSLTDSIVWDARNDPLPTSLTITVNAGTNNSVQNTGQNYQLRTASGSAQDIWIASTDTYDLSTLNALSFKITGLTFSDTSFSQSDIQIGIVNSLTTTTRGTLIHWQASLRKMGNLLGWGNSASPRVYDSLPTYLLPYNDSTGGFPGQWRRSVPLDFEYLVYRHSGTVWLVVLINDKVAYRKDITLAGTVGVRPFLRIFNRTTFPQVSATFTSLAVRTG